MEIKRLNRGEAKTAMDGWKNSFPNLPETDGDYAVIRNDLTGLFESVRDKAAEKGNKAKDYYTDEQFGMLLYTYLSGQNWFSTRLAADDGFWRYMSIIVIPDIVAERWGKDNDDHYWAKPGRIWLKQLWWYIYLSWNENESITRTIVESGNCSTDTILNFVERTGKKGTCVNAYRNIIRIYSRIPAEKLSEYNKKRKSDLFRIVMKLNTARMMVMEPELCPGGCKGYAEKLFTDAGMEIQ